MKRSRLAVSPVINAVAVVVVALVVGGAAYYVGGSTVAPVTSTTTSTFTTAQTVTQTSTTTQTSTATKTQSQFPTIINLATLAGADVYYGANDPTVAPFYTQNGLSPQWITNPTETAGTLKNFVANGTVVGFAACADPLVARANGLPVKIIAAYVGTPASFAASLSSSTYTTMASLNGQKIGFGGVSASTITANDRYWIYMANKSGIQYTAVYLGNANSALTPGQQLAALQAGTVAAIATSDPGIYSMVATGQLRVVAYARDLLPTPWAANCLFATDSIIQSNPALVQAFVTASLQDVGYLSANPSYATSLYASKAGVSTAVATAGLALTQYTPSGKGSGTDLVAAATNIFQAGLATGSIPAGTALNVASAVTTQFLGQ